jgi:hypothetical protein
VLQNVYITKKCFSMPQKIYKKTHSLTVEAPSPLSFPRLEKGSFTVEAAFVMPIFLVFFLMLFTFFPVMRLESVMRTALTEAVRLCAVTAGFDGGESLSEEEQEKLLETGISSLSGAALVNVRINECGAAGWVKGAAVVTIETSDDGTVTGQAMCLVRVPFTISHSLSIPIHVVETSRAWIGYAKEEEDESEEQVYVTKTGVAYHSSLDCTYLKIVLYPVTIDRVGEYRSKDGSIYYPCEVCADKTSVGVVYIANYGNRYHTTKECKALVREIEQVPLSKVGGRHPCPKCYGN